MRLAIQGQSCQRVHLRTRWIKPPIYAKNAYSCRERLAVLGFWPMRPRGRVGKSSQLQTATGSFEARRPQPWRAGRAARVVPPGQGSRGSGLSRGCQPDLSFRVWVGSSAQESPGGPLHPGASAWATACAAGPQASGLWPQGPRVRCGWRCRPTGRSTGCCATPPGSWGGRAARNSWRAERLRWMPSFRASGSQSSRTAAGRLPLGADWRDALLAAMPLVQRLGVQR